MLKSRRRALGVQAVVAQYRNRPPSATSLLLIPAPVARNLVFHPGLVLLVPGHPGCPREAENICTLFPPLQG